jgi:ABC-type phosphate transport system substrate-binding protein
MSSNGDPVVSVVVVKDAVVVVASEDNEGDM